MTDNEIRKALECCGEDGYGCTGCPRLNAEFGATITSCSAGLATNALDLINRQKAEIERFRKNDSENFAKWNELAERTINHYEELFQVAKDAVREKAIKEFAERLKSVVAIHNGDMWSKYEYIDNLVKEMVGDDK